MKKTSKRSLNAVLAFILALNMSGCSWFGGDDEEDSKDITKHDEDKDKNKDKDDKKDNKKKKDDEDKERDKVDEKDNDDRVIHYTDLSSKVCKIFVFFDLSSKVCKIFVFFGGRVIRPPFLCISVSQMEVPMNRLKKNA